MRTRQESKLAFESLESRQLFSGSRSSVAALINDVAALSPVAVAAPVAEYSRAQSSSVSDATRWDWLADTHWYVPVANLLAYATPGDLSNPTAIGDQTLWHIDQSTNGQISGTAVVNLSFESQPTERVFTGIVTKGGQIRMEFTQDDGQSPTTGIGQMRYVNGAWTMQMQMATGSSLVVTHWAYMVQHESGTTPPDASDPTSGSSAADNWQWLEGTQWAIVDKAMFGTKKAGVFTIDEFNNGYFWGSGKSGKKPFNVLGSVTPEGNLLLVVSVNGASPSSRTGLLVETGNGGVMTLRTYEGDPAIGFAVSLATTNSNSNFTSSVLAAMRGITSCGSMSTKEIRAIADALQHAGKQIAKAPSR